MLKCNVDGSWKDGKGRIRVIVHDSLSLVIFSGIFPVLTTISLLHVEILAVLKGLELAKAFYIQCLCLETKPFRVLGIHPW